MAQVRVRRRVPRLDGPTAEGPVLVRNHAVQVDFDDVAEALARRAGAEGVVERKQAWLRFQKCATAAGALQPLAETQPPVARNGYHDYALPFAVGEIHRIGPARLLATAEDQAIDHHVHRFAGLQHPRG